MLGGHVPFGPLTSLLPALPKKALRLFAGLSRGGGSREVGLCIKVLGHNELHAVTQEIPSWHPQYSFLNFEDSEFFWLPHSYL